jgi:hypothetical protein
VHARFLDYARWRLSWRSWACCLPLHRQRRHPESVFYRGSMASPHVPLPKLACARLGADVVRYSIVVDWHHLLLAAHLCENAGAYRTPFDRRASRKSRRIEKDWPSVQHVCRVTRFRQGKKNGQWKDRQSAGRRDGARSASVRQPWPLGQSRSCIETRTPFSVKTATLIDAAMRRATSFPLLELLSTS